MRPLFPTSLTSLLLLLAGCEATSPTPAAPRAAEQAPGSQGGQPTSIILNGTAVSLDRVTTASLEAAGAVALEEVMLDHLLDREIAAAKCTLATDAAEQERQRLFERIAAEAGVAQDQAGVLIDRFRKSRGLGPTRFAALLARNAKLRALVRQSGMVKPEEIEQGVAAELDARATARLIVVPSSTEAASIRSSIEAAAPADRGARFAQLAYQSSRDRSSSRGGLFGPVSHSDPTVPAAIRPLLALPAGELSPIVAIESGFAMVLIEEQLPASPADEASRAIAAAKVTTRREREAMEKLASELLSEAKLTILNEPLRWSWEQRLR
jgi:parvulin-like peptidyl-prolyl isomerase